MLTQSKVNFWEGDKVKLSSGKDSLFKEGRYAFLYEIRRYPRAR